MRRRTKLAMLLTLALMLLAALAAGPASASGDAVVVAPTDGTPTTVTTTTPGQNGRILFEVAASQRIYIACSHQILDSRIATALHDPAAKLAGAWCNPQGATLYDTRGLAGAGTHSIFVDQFNDLVGSFTVRVFAIPADPILVAARDGSPVRVETPVPGQNATIVVDGVQGRALRVQVSERTYDAPGLRQDHPALARRRPGVDAPCTAAGTRTTPVLPVSGSYTLLVDPSHLETGGASFAITLA